MTDIFKLLGLTLGERTLWISSDQRHAHTYIYDGAVLLCLESRITKI